MQDGLYKSLNSYKEKDIYPFHMPGHKRNPNFLPTGSLLDYDVTEIPGMDNLQNPKGVLLSLEDKIAKACKSKKSFISVNGSSGGILASLLALLGEGDEVLLARNSHIAAYNGLILSGASPVYVYPQITDYGLCGGILPSDIERELIKNSNIKAVFITSPTYEGFCSDIKGIAEIVHKHGKILIVDEAHGAHFGFHPLFPLSAISQGADISIQSLHKTLPSFGQSAVVHIGSGAVDANRLKQTINMINTTSPSYIFLSGIDFLFSKIINEFPDIFNKYVSTLIDFENNINRLKSIKKTTKLPLKGFFGIADIDIGKLVFCLESRDKTGQDISNFLLNKHKVQLEAAHSRHIIAMTSIADTEAGFLRLSDGLLEIDKTLKSKAEYDIINICAYKADIVLTPKQAFNSEKEVLSLKETIGRICGEFVVPYPPGIPIVAPGELITEQVALQLHEYYIETNPEKSVYELKTIKTKKA
jgi:lysine decarboxylase